MFNFIGYLMLFGMFVGLAFSACALGMLYLLVSPLLLLIHLFKRKP